MIARRTAVLAAALPLFLLAQPSSAQRPQRPGPPTPASAPAVEPLPNVDVTLRSVQWQVLPATVTSVSISPDDRCWYRLERTPLSYTQRLSPAQVQRVVEAEFAKPAPQLQGLGSLWFERQGVCGPDRSKLKRVWLTAGPSLMGYAGTPGRWIERGTHSHAWEAMAQLSDGVYFFDKTSAHRFDGNTWTLQEIMPGETAGTPSRAERMGNKRFECLTDDDGRGMVVICRSSKSGVWRCRQSKWTQLPLGSDPKRPVEIASAVRFGNRLCLQMGGWVDLDLDQDADRLAAQVKTLVAALGSAKMAERDAAFAKLQAMGQAVLPLLRDELAKAADPEASARLQELVRQLATAGKPGIAGPANLPARLTAMYADDGGNVYMEGQTEPGGRIERTLAIRRGDGKCVEPPEEWTRWSWRSARAVPGTNGNQVWVPSSSDHQLRLYDLAEMKVLCQFPHQNPNDNPVAAIRADGTVFLKAWSSLTVYQPRQKDDTITLQPYRDPQVRGDVMCVDANGNIWADTVERGLTAWNGNKWILPPRETLSPEPVVMMPGRGGWMLTFEGTRYKRNLVEPIPMPRFTLFNSDVRHTARTVWELAAEQEDFRRGFGQGFANQHGIERRVVVVAEPKDGYYTNVTLEEPGCGSFLDKAGNLWVLLFGQLRVRSGEQWLTPCPPDELATDDSPPPQQPLASAIHPLGDGRYVHVLWRKPFFVTLESGKFRYAPSPAARSVLAGPGGKLWMEQIESKNGRLVTSTRAATAVDKSEEIGPGRPMLVDAAGCVWLMQRESGASSGATVHAPDGSTAQVALPGYVPDVPLIAGKPGVVFIPTSQGFHRFAAAAAKPAAYAPAELYRLQTTNKRFVDARDSVRYSSLGWLAAIKKDPTPSFLLRLYLYKLPADAKAGPSNR